MKPLGAALERKAHGGAGGDAIVRRIVRGHHVEFRDGVLRGHDAHAAGAAAIISFAAVDKPDVMALAESVNADGEVRSYRSWRVAVGQGRTDAHSEGSQGGEVAILGGDFAD